MSSYGFYALFYGFFSAYVEFCLVAGVIALEVFGLLIERDGQWVW